MRLVTSANAIKKLISNFILSMTRTTNIIVIYSFSKIKTVGGRSFVILIITIFTS